MAGYVPGEIIYVCKPEKEIRVIQTDEMIKVYSAFPVPKDATDALINTARKWARQNSYIWDPALGRMEEIPDYQIYEFTELNESITSLRVVGYSHRSEGGCAYRVVIKDRYLVDLREEEFLRAIMTSGIHSAGHIDNIDLRWILNYTQMRLVYQDSRLFEEAAACGHRRSMSKISSNQLHVGGVYYSKSGDRGIYLGRKKMPNGRNGFAFLLLAKSDPKKDLNTWINGAEALTRCGYLTSSHSYVEQERLLSIDPTQLASMLARAI